MQNVRRFNRQWTQFLGLLGNEILQTDHSLTDARVIFELAQREAWERLALRELLQIDDSYLTRILKRLADKKLVKASVSKVDGRRKTIALTKKGRSEFRLLDKRSSKQLENALSSLTGEQKRTLGEAMIVIPRLLHLDKDKHDVSIRGLESGDLGWVIQRHGEIYFDELGWNTDFEVLVARIVAEHQTNHEPGHENAWIAEVDGARAGCIFCGEKDASTASLRILLVEPWARGMGIGSQLVDLCVSFARNSGYSTLVLWTNDVLVSARKIYEAAGFELVDEENHTSFGRELVGQNWTLHLHRAIAK